MPPVSWPGPREHRDDRFGNLRLRPDKTRTGPVLALSTESDCGWHEVQLSPARARAIAADLLAFADEAEPAQDHAEAAQRLDAVEKRLAALEGKREVVGYRVRWGDGPYSAMWDPNDAEEDGSGWQAIPNCRSMYTRPEALRLLRHCRKWTREPGNRGHYGFRLVRVVRRA